MTTMGTVKNGVIVPDASDFPEGTRVQIVTEPVIPKGFTLDDLKAVGHPILVEDYSGEFDQLNRMLREERDAEVRALQALPQGRVE